MNIQNAYLDSRYFSCHLGSHNKKPVIWICFPYHIDLVKIVKSIPHSKWSFAKSTWYLPNNPTNRIICGVDDQFLSDEVLLKIDPINRQALEMLRNTLTLKAYSQNTIKTYCIAFAQFLYRIKNNDVNAITSERLQSYFLYCTQILNHSENYIHCSMNAIKFYYEKVVHRPKMFFDIPRPKKQSKLPKALNTKEITQLFKVTNNPKHRLMLQLTYGMGLRVSEVVNLKIRDIDSHDMKVLIECSKGKKDRYVQLPHSILENMRIYYQLYRPSHYLFESASKVPMNARTVQKVFKQAMQKANITKTVGVHGLRHSYATHLLQMGTNIALIKELLGHKDIKTTLIYAQVAPQSLLMVKSPLDYIKT